jgi:thioredoxin-related protein
MSELVWGNDLSAALGTAAKENKLLFIAFSNPDCKMCMKMEESTLSEDLVKDYLCSKFILLRYRSSKNPEKYLRLKVTETPTYIVLGVNGNELLRISGFFSPDEILEKLESVSS